MVHVGLDLHIRVSQMGVLTAKGEITRHRLVNEECRMEQFFQRLPSARVAIEVSSTWWWFVDLLQRLPHQCLSQPNSLLAHEQG